VTQRTYITMPRRRGRLGCCLAALIVPVLLIGMALLSYLLLPGRTNILVLGIDARPGEGDVGRSDTMILTTFLPAYVGMLSIPRDLWVNVPDVGEQRINTAHFFAEAAQPGSGPAAAMDTVRQNFGVNVDYFVRLRFDGLRSIVDAMGGIEVTLPRAMSGYEAGTHHLNGEQALALVRDRSGSDDIARNERALIFLKSAVRQMLRPASWLNYPAISLAVSQAVDTNVPLGQWPRLGIIFLRVGADKIDARGITHEMVLPFQTSQGASVLLPQWEWINPVLLEVFGQ
jgi:LCP family protein required for cell wall assembly